MEVAGLVIGGVSMAGLFTTCVNCFEYIQLGRHFDKDYRRSLLKLDTLQLRISRWAAAINEWSSGEVVVGSLKDAETVKRLLSEIIDIFADAEKVSERFSTKQARVLTVDVEIDPEIVAIHQQMKKLSLKKLKRSTFAQKTAWALYEEKHFNRLIEDLNPLVSALVELFPAVQERQRVLSQEEAEEMKSEQGLHMLGEAADGLDDLLRDSVNEVVARQQLHKKHEFDENLVKDGAIARYGDEVEDGNMLAAAIASGVGGSVYQKNEASGNVIVHYGDHYGGGSIFSNVKRPGAST